MQHPLETVSPPWIRDRALWLALTGFALLALFGIVARPLLPVDETRYLAVAWEMRQSGNWLVPHLNGVPYSDKPPLLFWLINLVWLPGVSESAARLVGPAFGLAALAATARLGTRLWPDQPGLGGRAALILASFGFFAGFGGLTMFDMLLTFAVLLGVGSLVTAATHPRFWIPLGCALAFGAFAKGPVILIHLLPLALTLPFWSEIGFRAALPRVLLAILVGLGLVAVWLVPALLFGGADYREAVLWTQSAGRVTNVFDHARPWWFFVALLPLLLWPWIWSGDVWGRVRGLRPGRDRATRLCLIWAGSTLLLFSLIGSKQAHYLLPAFPAVALLLARVGLPNGARARPAGLLPLIVGLGLAGLALGLLPADKIAHLLSPVWAVLLLAVLFVALGGLAWRARAGAIALLGFGFAACANLSFLLTDAGQIHDASRVAALISPSDTAGVGVVGKYSGEFNFAARLTQPVQSFATMAEAESWLAARPGRVLVSRLEDPRPDTPPAQVLFYRNHDYGLWRTTPAP